MALQFPNCDIKDADGNLRPPSDALFNVKGLELGDIHYDNIGFLENGKQRPPEECWPYYLHCMDQSVQDKWCKTVVTDSLTTLDFWLVKWVMKKLGKDLNMGTMEIQDWVPFRNQLSGMLMKLRHIGKTSIVLVHEEKTTDRQGNVVRYDPTISSRISNFLGWMFTDHWRCERLTNGQHQLITGGYGLCDLKRSMPMPNIIPIPLGGVKAALNPYIHLWD